MTAHKNSLMRLLMMRRRARRDAPGTDAMAAAAPEKSRLVEPSGRVTALEKKVRT